MGFILGCIEEWVESPSLKSEDSDLGFSECFGNKTKSNQCIAKPRPNNNKGVLIATPEKLDPRLMLQQVRVALEKIPIKQEVINLKRKGVQVTQASDLCKKAKLESEEKGKITNYMSESKHFDALRKEKLDRVLNLKTETESQANSKLMEMNKNELFLITTTQFKKQLRNELISNQDAKTDSKSLLAPSGEGLTADSKEIKFEVPRAIRFPAQNGHGGSRLSSSNSSTTSTSFPTSSSSSSSLTSELVPCKWRGCNSEFESPGELLDHLKAEHASNPHVTDNENEEEESDTSDSVIYKCLWKGCKVFGKSSSSKSWLEKHVMLHGGNKPFQCIVFNCKMRFGTQALLERHVNSHFNASSSNGASSNGQNSGQSGQSNKKLGDNHSASYTPSSSTVKLIKKTGKKLKYRKTIYSARIFDLFDLGIMAQVRERLLEVHKNVGLEDNGANCQEIKFVSQVVGKRKDPEKGMMVLQRWSPSDM